MGYNRELPAVCLYETLGAERNASAEDIKALYRKQALRWHPDKIQQSGASPEECQEATARFQAISHAYDVLSDPQERAWYDSHRSAILASSSRAPGSSSSYDYDVDLFSYFSASAYSGWGDSGDGFYAVYERAFQQVHDQERSFARAYGGNVAAQSPPFGSSSSPHADFLAFYKFWQTFSTVKDFAWCDAYKVSDGPNRKSRRLMEEENLKIRKVERREFNDTVRELASFVKKRDKRVLQWQLEQQRLQKEKEEMLKLKRKQLQEEKRAKALQYQEEEWCKLHEADGAEVSGEEDERDEDQGSYEWNVSRSRDQEAKAGSSGELQELFCIVCNKRFRSDKQWQNHEKSKKHKAKAEALKETLEDEDEHAEELLGDTEVAQENSADIEACGGPMRSGSGDLQADAVDEDGSEPSASEDGGESMLEAMLNSHRNRSRSSTVEDPSSKDDDSPAGTSYRSAADSSQSGDVGAGMDVNGTEEDLMMAAMLSSLASRKHVSFEGVASDDNGANEKETSISRHRAAHGLEDGVQSLELSSGDEDAGKSVKGSQTEKRQDGTAKGGSMRGAKPRRRATKQGKNVSVGADRHASVVSDTAQQKPDTSTPNKSGSSDLAEARKRRNRT